MADDAESLVPFPIAIQQRDGSFHLDVEETSGPIGLSFTDGMRVVVDPVAALDEVLHAAGMLEEDQHVVMAPLREDPDNCSLCGERLGNITAYIGSARLHVTPRRLSEKAKRNIAKNGVGKDTAWRSKYTTVGEAAGGDCKARWLRGERP